ncbi:MAG: hypothetical protein HYR64_08790 [Fimbriimonas ginsengisoli]|uniref:Uncharacterized protein n=1 Tax=Fimbriimonas ginsengisoli TaxID=1005039 RepID=A0A931LTR7_FIMGI|nr:hypothetical protein [Fimbriimonas ginsengisoli]
MELAIILSIVNVAVISVPLIIWLFRDCTLDFELTAETFFRLIDQGESLFAYGAIVPEGAAAKITDVTLRLVKIDDATKSYPLKVLAYGTRERSFGTSAEHYFYTRSPVHYLPVDQVYRPVWHCVLETYASAIEIEFREWENYLLGLKTKHADAPADDEDLKRKVEQEVEARRSSLISAVMDKVQLERGFIALRRRSTTHHAAAR